MIFCISASCSCPNPFSATTPALQAVPNLAGAHTAADFGYQLAYEKPSDHVSTVGIYSDEYGQVPLLQYNMEQQYLFADVEPIFWYG